MKATVKITYADTQKNRQIEVECSDRLKGAALLNQIDRKVAKALTDADDTEWDAWQLIEIS